MGHLGHRLLQLFRDWFHSPPRRARKLARRELDRLFGEHSARLRGTSLRPKHRGRTQILHVEAGPLRIHFGIVRHPRPYAFSQQFHEVLEVWCYDVESGRLERQKGVNLSRQRGEDGDPSSYGTGV